MPRYIDAYKAKENLTEIGIFDGWISAESACNAIDDTPTADVAEVRHGEWIDMREAYNDVPVLKCTNCGEKLYVAVNPKYCPNCGAKMDLKSEGK